MGFILLAVFILLPLTIMFGIFLLVTKESKWLKYIGITWFSPFVLLCVLGLFKFFLSKKTLKKSDYYGIYFIDTTKYPGKQARWQFNHLKFEIKENDSIICYVINDDESLSVYSGTISTLNSYEAARLQLKMNEPKFHVFADHPTLYRTYAGFYLVFDSKKFGNVFFVKL
jgi:hypothetical protein